MSPLLKIQKDGRAPKAREIRSTEARSTSTSARTPAWRRFLRRPLGVAAAIWLVVVLLGAALAPVLAPYNAQSQDLSASLSGPSAQHLLGTDQLGRDVLSQLLFGAGPTLIGVAAALATWLIIGMCLGVIAGYIGGHVDTAVSRLAELLLSLPALVVLLVIFAVFPNKLIAPMALLGVISSAGLIRVVRGATMTVRSELYVRAAEVAGVSRLRIVVRHIVPRITATVIVQAALFAGVALVVESGLAFLGFGIVPPNPSWGGEISEASQYMAQSAWMLVPSGGVLGLTVMAFILVGNAVRDTSTETWAKSALVSRRQAVRRRNRGSSETGPRAQHGDSGVAPLLSVDHLTVELRSRDEATWLVTDVSFELERGETLAVLGESGCGKTITALAILDMLPAGVRCAGGRVLLEGRDLTHLSDRELQRLRGRRIGYVAQDPLVSLDPTFTVGAQIAEAIRHHAHCGRREARHRAIELLDRVQIPDAAAVSRRYPHQLSGGMLQRCVIALALSGEPDLLIADEPTTALDVTVQAEILALLAELGQERGLAILLVTHDWGVVAQVAARAIVMYAGEIVERASVNNLLTNPAHPYVRGLQTSDPHSSAKRGRLPTIPGTVPLPGNWPAGCRFAPRCSEAEGQCWHGPIELHEAAPGHAARCVHADMASEELESVR